MLTLQQASQWLINAAPVGDMSVSVLRVVTDTRSLRAGDLFVALKGDIFDAHDFLLRARVLGAVAAIAEHGIAAAGLPGLEVADTRLALGELAAGWRARFEVPLIAVTGSNGKTTVTQMIACILRVWKHDKAFATEGNFNNDIGVPLTVLRLHAACRAAVIELGMNHPGEIAELAKIAQPTVGLVNNAQREHQEFMASVEAVAIENGAVIQSLPSNGTAVFPADDPFASLWRGYAKETGRRKVVTFGLTDEADVSCTWKASGFGSEMSVRARTVTFDVTLMAAGQHNVRNALAAIACALALGIKPAKIARGLAAFAPVNGRLQRKQAVNGAQVIDDSYNANPDSVRAAIDVLAHADGPKVLVLGDMGEVGGDGRKYHEEVGAYARGRGIARLLTLGDLAQSSGSAFGAHANHFTDIAALLQSLDTILTPDTTVLVKGSRFMQMERVVQHLTGQSQQDVY